MTGPEPPGHQERKQKMTTEKKELTREDLTAAIKLVNDEIAAYENELRKTRDGQDQDPIMVEGETEKGYYCQLMVDPKDAARIMLDYDYPKYKILGDDAPEEMWEKLGEFYGLAEICSVDL